jgi:transcriptional pleiotropic repressor
MSVQLLDKTRKINNLLHNNDSDKVVFNDICTVLSDIMESNVLVFSYKGKILGAAYNDAVNRIDELLNVAVGDFVDEQLNDRLLDVLSTKENVNMEMLGFVSKEAKSCQAIINPVDIAGERLGTVFMYRNHSAYSIDDIILSEYGTTVVSLEMLRSVNEESEEESRKLALVQSAFATLSHSEYEAIKLVLKELDGAEGVLIASRIADRFGITRSVIVNALRKFESAGIIETKSAGMKGTYIKVLNDVVFEELSTYKA